LLGAACVKAHQRVTAALSVVFPHFFWQLQRTVSLTGSRVRGRLRGGGVGR
jgi:hypothetical protein